jgi:rhodanese-related sulfurtransferase
MSSLLRPSQPVLLEALVLVIVAASAGLSLNYQMVMQAFTGRNIVTAPQISTPGADRQFPLPVDYAELDELLAAGHLLIDARDPQIYADAHLPGAISLPLGKIDLLFDKFSARFPRETPLIIYCNGFGCPDSFDLGLRLIAEGYANVQVYEGGFPEWRDRGRQLESGGAP